MAERAPSGVHQVDVYDVPGALGLVKKWGGGHLVTPTFDIDGEIILNFDLDKVKAALGR